MSGVGYELCVCPMRRDSEGGTMADGPEDAQYWSVFVRVYTLDHEGNFDEFNDWVFDHDVDTFEQAFALVEAICEMCPDIRYEAINC